MGKDCEICNESYNKKYMTYCDVCGCRICKNCKYKVSDEETYCVCNLCLIYFDEVLESQKTMSKIQYLLNF